MKALNIPPNPQTLKIKASTYINTQTHHSQAASSQNLKYNYESRETKDPYIHEEITQKLTPNFLSETMEVRSSGVT